MDEDIPKSNSIIQIGSQSLVRTGKAIEITNKIIFDRAKAFYDAGIIKLENKDSQGAIQDFNMAIEYNPLFADSYFRRAYTKWDIRDLEGAMQDYDNAIMHNANNSLYYVYRGDLKYGCYQDYLGAIKDYTKALEIEQTDDICYWKRAKTYNALKDYKKAIEDLDKAIGQDTFLVNWFYYDLRGYSKSMIGNFEDAILDYTLALKYNHPACYKVFCNRGIAKIGVSDYSGAIADFNKSIELKPDYKRALEELEFAKSYLKI